MKRNMPVFITLSVVLGIATFVSFLFFMWTLLLSGTDIIYHQKYTDPQNYVELDATITEVDEHTESAIWIKLYHEQYPFFDNAVFLINGRNYDIAVDKGIIGVLSESEVIHIRYIDHGDFFIIAHLNYNGVDYLPLENGVDNIAADVKNSSDSGIKYLSIFGSAMVFGLILIAVNIIVFCKAKPTEKEPNAA